jgi:hypothetical protein
MPWYALHYICPVADCLFCGDGQEMIFHLESEGHDWSLFEIEDWIDRQERFTLAR